MSPPVRPIRRVLVANRGEIAVRVMRTCKERGLGTVAVYSDADRLAPHVLAADFAVHIGAAPASQSYLVIDKILAACKESGADAVHPGYGFLSENDGFAQACVDAGLIFVGPPAAALRAMGSKSASKAAMAAVGVPVAPGYHGEEQSPQRLAAEAERVGFPLIIKASAGGGGKGMRIAHSKAEVAEGFARARSEGKSSYGDERVFIEKFITDPRHIEIQVLGDKHGNVIHLGERECSIQRRNQKVI